MADEGLWATVADPYQRNRSSALLGMPVLGWLNQIAVAFSSTAGSNSTGSPDQPISADINVCSIISIGGAAWFKQGDAAVVATADGDDSIHLPADQWVDVTTATTKYISFIQAAGSSASLAQIVERG